MNRFTVILSLAIILGTTGTYSQNTQSFFDEADAFLKRYVTNGNVNYASLKNNPSSLNKLMALASDVTVSKAEATTYQAFWINAYNISVIKGIIDNYPIKSPLDTKGFFDKTTYQIGGTSITLNDIENKKLRAQFEDPRFHFVLVCGAKGCPPLIPKAFTPDNLESLLEQQTVNAINNPDFIMVKGNKVALSEIFKWYKEDFVKDGTEIDFLNSYRTEKIPQNAKVSYYPYNWQLNSQ